MNERISVSPKGHITFRLEDEQEVKMLLDFSAMADADEYLGRSLIQGLMVDQGNFHLLRVAFYFSARHVNPDLKIRSVKQAGAMLRGLPLDVVIEAVGQAMIEGGVTVSDDPDDQYSDPLGLADNGDSADDDDGELEGE